MPEGEKNAFQNLGGCRTEVFLGRRRKPDNEQTNDSWSLSLMFPLPFRLSGILCVLALGLGGCAVTSPDFERLTQEAVPAAWQRTSLPAGDFSAWADFWARWQDPVLVRLVEQALEANPDIESAAASLRSASASLSAADAALLPTAKVGADAGRRRADGMTRESYSIEGSAGLTLNLAGSEFWKADAAALRASAAVYSLDDVRAATAAETASAYLKLRSAEAQLDIARRSLTTYAETAEVARWQFEAGTGQGSAAEDALVQLASARARIPALEGALEQYRNALMRLTGRPVESLGLEVTGILPEPPEGLAAVIPAEAVARRPDVRAARRTVEAAVEGLRSARADFFPTLSLTGNIGTTAATVSALGASGTGIVGLTAALSATVLNWGALSAAEEGAAAELDRSVAAYRSKLLAALEETDNALSTVANAERRQADLEQALLHAHSAEVLARQEYSAGTGEYTMLLSAQRSLLSAEESELSNRADRAAGCVALYRALGGGWNSVSGVMGNK